MAHGVKVVLVVSDTMEKNYYENFDIHVIIHPNNPLGAKWQAGVDYARQLDPSHVVITGSDDLLSIGFFEKYCTNEAMSFGMKSWFVWCNNKLHHLDYKIEQPLGGGRVYSRWHLKDMDYKLFDVNQTKWLDDYGWKHWRGLYCPILSPEILAVKGNWPMMNPVDLKHRNVKLIATFEGDEALKIMKDKHNYDAKGIL
jgi:hypothetical protein